MYVSGKDVNDVLAVRDQLEASGATVVTPASATISLAQQPLGPNDATESWRKAAVVKCDELVVLPDYEESEYGAIEFRTARLHDKPVWFAHRDGLLWRLVYEDDTPAAPTTELDHEGLYPEAASTISTWRGKRVNVLDPKVEDIEISDIAHSLARSCRYNGHVGGFLSVARHSMWVSNRLKAQGENTEMLLWGLLHDASEAYIGDMVKPLKHDDSMKPFRDTEERFERVIAQAFDLVYPMPDVVKEADTFVTVEVELGVRLRDTHETDYRDDEREFENLFYDLVWQRDAEAAA